MISTETKKTAARFDMYLAVHKGLRAFMVEVLTTVGRMDSSDSIEVADGITQARSLLDICRAHLFAENQYLHTAMEARRRGSASVTANDHVQQEEFFEQLESRILAVERSFGAVREVNVLELYRTLATFVADNFQHMQLEERDNNATLQSLYSDDELRAIHQELLQSINPEWMRVFLRWIFPHVSPNERLAIVAGMRQEMPKVVFEQLLPQIRRLLNEKDWSKLNVQILHFN